MTILRHAYALSGSTLVSFNPAFPLAGTSIPVTGPTETLVGIDVRPSNGLLYGLGVNAATDTATLYNISVLTGVATIVGSFGPALGLDLPGSGYGFDFNPVVDRIRVTTETGLNFRVNPNNGSLTGIDTAILGSAISGVAYTNDETTNGGVTAQYSLDAISNTLKIANGPGGPNGGIQNPVGSVGVNFSTANGFDIPPGVDTLVANSGVPSGSGLALLTVGVGTVQLYSIDLVSGAGTLIGFFLDGVTPASGLAILNTPSGADFNIDGRGDILWRHDSGQVYFWNMNGLQTNGEGSVAHAPVPNDWHIEGTGDFNGDFNSDILWRHDSGQVYFWEMNGLAIKAEGGVAHAPVPNDWHIQGVGDFDADGHSDILWRHDSGQVYFWEMNGLTIKAEGGVAHAPVPNDWHIQRLGDFDGDAKSDILWRHDSGQVYIWEMNGLGIKAEGGIAHAAVPNDWHVQGIGDFNNDGNSDILWRHDSGQVYIWETNGLGIKAEGGVAHALVPNDWHIQSVGDFNGDGKSDILWRQDGSGQVYVWEMNGLQVTAEGAVAHAPVPSEWHVFSDQNFI